MPSRLRLRTDEVPQAAGEGALTNETIPSKATETQNTHYKDHFTHCQRKSGLYGTLFMAAVAVGGLFFLAGAIATAKAWREEGRLDWWPLLVAGIGLVCFASAPALKARYRDWSSRLDDAELDLI
jgi:hypothetical protein